MRRLGEQLVEGQRLTPAGLDEALHRQRQQGGRLGRHLVRLGCCSESDVAAVLARRHRTPAIAFAASDLDPAVVALVPADLARKYQVIPVARAGSAITLAMADPSNVVALDDIRFLTGCVVEPVVAPEHALLDALDRYYGDGDARRRSDDGALERAVKVVQDAPHDGDVEDTAASDAPAVELVNRLLLLALRRGASDIHIEPYAGELRVRLRVDGVLYHALSPPVALKDAVTSRIKIMARLDIAEKRLPQDGRVKVRFDWKGERKDLDIRVSVLPTLFGERVVLRLLDRDALRLDMSKLGLEPGALSAFDAAIQRPWGMVLVTGPTGSGKTNTLYSAIARINTLETNILTVEDPVEFNLPGINQLQVREAIGLTFAAALRSFLRQDPNVVLVGEIRDAETAEIGVKAALTGHLVLSTLHTNDAPATINRLIDMGIEPFLVASSLQLVCAQRLVRRICAHCGEPDRVPPAALVAAGFPADEATVVVARRGRGCDACNGTGYRGRIGLFEVMTVDESIRELILGRASVARLREAAVAGGMTTLRQSGLWKVRHGVTTLGEVLRETVA